MAGIALASRLSQLLPESGDGKKQILVLEAGTDPSTSDSVLTFVGQQQAQVSEHATILNIAANENLGGRVTTMSVGKALGGSGAINGGAWTRGPKSDYDLWAKIVGDDDWSYDKLLPYFRRTEAVVQGGDGEGRCVRDDVQHGYDGALKLTPLRANWPNRRYPLREPLRKAWEELGVKYLPDGNNEQQNGLTELVEVWLGGRRQLPGKIFDLSKVEIRDMSPVRRVTFEQTEGGEPVANGVDLVDGEHISAKKEVIICAGVFHTPQVLMLSGIGDPATLEKHGISTVAANVEVGKNLKDHLGVWMTWKLKHPEKGLAIGSPLFADPSFFTGWPMDFIEFGPLDEPDRLEPLIANAEDRDLLLRPDASHMELAFIYAPHGRSKGVDTPMDGSYISSLVILLTPTSKGSITLNSSHPQDPPVVDVNFYATETDRHIMREALRKAYSVTLETESGKSFVSHEVPPEGYEPITNDTSDEVLDRRVAEFGNTVFHPMGSCSMGKVVDSHCRVKGVRALRIVDASVFPVPLACHIQAAVYCLAERLADWIARGE